jgi:hypothetical protein
VLVYNNDAIGQQNSNPASRGVGLFFDVYGANATASAMIAWVWGVSRIIDALERTPNANINTKKMAVTGCSRDGKGALMAGAFESRIALTIPQESGSGGDTCRCIAPSAEDIKTEAEDRLASVRLRAEKRRCRPAGDRDRPGECLVLDEL